MIRNRPQHETDARERYVVGVGGPLIAYEHIHRYALAASIVSGLRVLDLGCGSGHGARVLRAAGADVVSVDINSGILGGLEGAVAGSADRLPFRDASFDAVVCFELVEHLQRPDLAIAEAARTLKADGVALVSTPDRDVYTERAGQSNPYHLSEMTAAEFEEALGRSFSCTQLHAQSVWAGSWIGPPRAGEAADPESLSVAIHPLPGDDAVTPRPSPPWISARDRGFPTGLYLLALCTRNRKAFDRWSKAVGEGGILHDRGQWLLGDYLRVLEAIRDRDKELSAAAVHAENMDDDLSRARDRITRLEEHVANLETALISVEVRRSEHVKERHAFEVVSQEQLKRIRALEEHAENLQDLSKGRAGRIASLEEHAANLVALLGERDRRIASLEIHSANLECVGLERAGRIASLEEHAANLVVLLGERDRRISSLEAHSGNLGEVVGEKAQRIETLASHVMNLEALLFERTRQLECELQAAKSRCEGESQSRRMTEKLLVAERTRLEEIRRNVVVRVLERFGWLGDDLPLSSEER